MNGITNSTLKQLAGEFAIDVFLDSNRRSFAESMESDQQFILLIRRWEDHIHEFFGELPSKNVLATRRDAKNQNALPVKWAELAPKQFGKVVHYDHLVGSMSYILRLEAGAKGSGIETGNTEECLVISGSLQVGDKSLSPGDRLQVPNSVVHGDTSTETGAILLVRTQDE